jgi:hypothetical protein
MRYWVFSPNIGGGGGSPKNLAKWKEFTRKYKTAFMGWPPGGKDDTKGLGGKFAEDYGTEEIIILIAHRQRWKWVLVACGKVASAANPTMGSLLGSMAKNTVTARIGS